MVLLMNILLLGQVEVMIGYLNNSLNIENLIYCTHFFNLKPYLSIKLFVLSKRAIGKLLETETIAKYNGGSIIDYKTKRKTSGRRYMYEYLQTTCYAQMFEETGQELIR